MSKLNIDQKTIKQLFADKKTDFLIPDYQRPYAWGKLSVKHFGMTFLCLQFPKMMQLISRRMKNIFLDQLLPSRMKVVNRKLLMGNNVSPR